MNKPKLIRYIAFAGMAVLALACQDITDELVGKKPDDAQTIHITVVAKSASNPVFQSARIGAEAAAEDLSEKYSKIDVQIDWRTPKEEDPREQADRILNAVEDGTDAIMVSCSDDSTLTAAINQAVARGVPVMTFDSDAAGSNRFAFYGPNDAETGERVVHELAALLNGAGQIAILGGNKNAPNLQKRVEGALQAAAKYPGIEVVGPFYHVETAEAAISEMKRVQNQYPDLKGWAMMGGWPFFSETLLDEMSPGKLRIVAVDALPVQLVYIDRGIVDVFLGQPTYRWGEIPVQTIVKKLHLGEEVPEFYQMKLIRVWKDNLGGWARQLRAWGYSDVPVEYLSR